MGRKSLANERTAQILDAFKRCITQYGLDVSFLPRIAKHYRKLIRAALNLAGDP